MSELLAKVHRLRMAGQALNTVGQFDELCQTIADLAAKITGVDIGILFLQHDDEHLKFAASHKYSLDPQFRTIRHGDGLVGWVAQHMQPVFQPDVRTDKRYIKAVDGVVAEICTPIVHQGVLLGVLTVESTVPGLLSDEDTVLLETFAQHCAKAIYGARMRQDSRARLIELKARSDRHELIHRIGQTLMDGTTLRASMQKVVDMVATTLNYSQTAVLLLDEKFDELELVCAYGYGEVDGLRIPISKGATGYAVRHCEPVNIPDVTTDPRYVKGILGGRSELVVPIVESSGAVCGVIDVESGVLNAFDNEDLQLLRIVASYTSAAISAARCKEELVRENALRKRNEIEVQMLSKGTQVLSNISHPDLIPKEVLRLIKEILGWSDSTIWMLEPETGRLRAELTIGSIPIKPGAHVPIGMGVPGEAAQLRAPVLKNIHEMTEMDIGLCGQHAQMAVPLWNGDEVAGVLQVINPKSSLTRADFDLLVMFGRQASQALTAITNKTDTLVRIRAGNDRTRRLDLLNRVARSLTKRLDIEALLDELLRLCAEAFQLSNCAVLLLDDTKSTLIRRSSIGYNKETPTVLTVGEGITGNVALTGVPILVADVSKDPRYITGVRGGVAEMVAPLRIFGEVIGVLDAESSQIGAFNEEDLDLFTCFAAQAAVAILSADLIAKIETLGNGK